MGGSNAYNHKRLVDTVGGSVENDLNQILPTEDAEVNREMRRCNAYRFRIENTVTPAEKRAIYRIWNKFVEDENELKMVISYIKIAHHYPGLVLEVNPFLSDCSVRRVEIEGKLEYFVEYQGLEQFVRTSSEENNG